MERFMMIKGCPLFFLVAAPLSMTPSGDGPTSVPPAQAEFFEKRIRPVLVEHCVSCHGSKKQQAGLRLDSRGGLVKGSEDGPVVVEGSPEKSPLIRAIHYKGDLRMPPKGKLPASAIADLTAWVKMGLPWVGGRLEAEPERADFTEQTSSSEEKSPEIRIVKYAGLAQEVLKHRGKVVLVDIWFT